MNNALATFSADPSVSLSHPKRILIIEDNAVHRRLMENELRRDYDLAFATDGQTALGYLQNPNLHFDLIILDSLIPPRQGELATMEEAVKILTAARYNSIVVVVSGSPTEQMKAQLNKYDVRKIFEKPFSLMEFREYVDSLFPDVQQFAGPTISHA